MSSWNLLILASGSILRTVDGTIHIKNRQSQYAEYTGSPYVTLVRNLPSWAYRISRHPQAKPRDI